MLRLSQLELLGFKSFPHKTVIDFDRGVTCIVGPNGSGKSNIGDAIQFAFGSQSGHELRAQRLNQLIFAGTDQLRQLNLASVTMHFECTGEDFNAGDDDDFDCLPEIDLDNLDLPEIASASSPAGSKLLDQTGYKGTDLTSFHYGGTAEAEQRIPAAIKQLAEIRPGQSISVTRRVFRDGTGGYFVNDDPVRLRDIDYLFNRFNLGRSAVFSVSQGEVEKKILSTAQEMREWLAEATGVALLLQQKTRAQSRLKRTRQNLDRLEDIRSNTRELVEDLAGQRAVAEQYQRFSAELRSVELYEIRREIEFGQRQLESSAKARTEVEGQLTAAGNELAAARDNAEQFQHESDQTELQIAEAENRLQQQREQLSRIQQEAAVARRALEAGDSATRQASEDLAESQAQLEELSREQKEISSQHEQARADQQAAKDAEQQGRQSMELARQALEAAAGSQEQVKKDIFDLTQEMVALRNEITTLEATGERVNSQLTARRSQQAEEQQKLASAIAELADERIRAGTLEQELNSLQTRLAETGREIETTLQQCDAAELELKQLRDEVSQLVSRKHTLEELADSPAYSGSGSGVLLQSASAEAQFSRAMELTFPDELRAAFTRLLAHIEDAVVCAPDARQSAVGLLSDGTADALVLIPGSSLELHPDSLWREASGDPQVITALQAMTGDVLVAESIASADLLLAENQSVGAAVIADGSALIGRSFAYLGAPPAERAMRVARRSDVESINRKLAELTGARNRQESAQAELRASLSRLQWNRDEMSARLAGTEERMRTGAELLERLERSVRERQESCDLLEAQIGLLNVDHDKLKQQLPVRREELAVLTRRQQDLEQQADAVAHEQLEAGARLEDARMDLSRNSTRRELATQKVKHLEGQSLDLAERINNLRNKSRQLEQRIGELAQELEQNQQLIDASSATVLELEQEIRELAGNLDSLKSRRRELTATAGRQQEAIDALVQRSSRLEQNLLSAESMYTRASERVSERLEELQQRFNLTLSELIADPTVAAPPPDASLDAAEAGRGKLREEKQRLAAAIEKLGAVNLLAIEQHQEHSTHLAFLDTQAADLARAVNDLGQLVDNLDQQTERQYKKNLRRIESRFNEIYLRLFESGWARLRFENPDDLINSGVEVEVQLPGTRRHQLRSLSGGQRSLIFLALFFAVHSVRSPGFCILDEADAALDDANVERFTTLIREFAQDEQFIIITHNKATMETADKLVGVVGRPKGVSNLLEVDMKQARRMIV